jgi:hypothetical protein
VGSGNDIEARSTRVFETRGDDGADSGSIDGESSAEVDEQDEDENAGEEAPPPTDDADVADVTEPTATGDLIVMTMGASALAG